MGHGRRHLYITPAINGNRENVENRFGKRPVCSLGSKRYVTRYLLRQQQDWRSHEGSLKTQRLLHQSWLAKLPFIAIYCKIYGFKDDKVPKFPVYYHYLESAPSFPRRKLSSSFFLIVFPSHCRVLTLFERDKAWWWNHFTVRIKSLSFQCNQCLTSLTSKQLSWFPPAFFLYSACNFLP